MFARGQAALLMFFKILVCRVNGDGAHCIQRADTLLRAQRNALLCNTVHSAPDGFQHVGLYHGRVLVERIRNAQRPGRRGRIVAAVLAVMCAAGVLIVHSTQLNRGNDQDHNEYLAWNDAGSHDTVKDIYTEFSNANRCLMLTGLYQYTVRGAAVTLWPQTTAADARIAELDDYYASHPKQAADTPMTGAFAGKNLILIMMESTDDWLVTPEYMPNLWQMEREGLYFPNYYSPMFLSAGTFNAEFTANTGLIAPEYHVRNSYYTEHALPYSLANLFRDAGYRAQSYHAAAPGIYNRGQIHLNFGYESYNDYAALGMDDYMLDSQLLRGYDQIVSDEPFFSFLITYSGHGPYTTEQQNIAEPHLERARAVIDYSTVPYATEAQKEEYTRAVAQAMETDAFIGGLRERLEADGHAEDTVLVLFTDHYCKYFSDADFINAIKGTTDHNMLSNVPFVIWTEGITPEVSEKIRQHDGHRADDRGPVLAGRRPDVLHRQRYVRPGRRRGQFPQLRVV